MSQGAQRETLADRHTGFEPPNRQFAILILCAPRVAYIVQSVVMGQTDTALEKRAGAIMNAFLVPMA